jgi:hypothetical protein
MAVEGRLLDDRAHEAPEVAHVADPNVGDLLRDSPADLALYGRRHEHPGPATAARAAHLADLRASELAEQNKEIHGSRHARRLATAYSREASQRRATVNRKARQGRPWMRSSKFAALVVAAWLLVGLLAAPSASAAPSQFKDSCKEGGYAAQGFGNQGQCVSFYNELDRALGQFVADCADAPPVSDSCLAAIAGVNDLLHMLPMDVAMMVVTTLESDPIIGPILDTIPRGAGGGIDV